MKFHPLLSYTLITLASMACQVQTNKNMNKQNPLLCDPETGVCEIPDSNSSINIAPINSIKPIKVIYFTDPICSSCWGIEPQLRKLKLEYGEILDIEYHMGGLLPDWNYNSGGISKPSDVAAHWDEVSVYYDMPIDGDLWLQDALHSSYPPSIAFKAAEVQDKDKAQLFLRALREMVFVEKKNITKWEHLEAAAKSVGLQTEQLKTDMEGKGKALFEEDLRMTKTYGVRGFPSIFFVDSSGKKEIVFGSKPYSFFEAAVLKLQAQAIKKPYPQNWESLFTTYSSLSAREFSELSGMARIESEPFLNRLVAEEKLERRTCKNGSLWSLKKKQ